MSRERSLMALAQPGTPSLRPNAARALRLIAKRGPATAARVGEALWPGERQTHNAARLLGHLVDRGLLVERAGTWHLTPTGAEATR